MSASILAGATKADIERGCVLALDFRNKEQLENLGATIYGDPVVHHGIEGDGSSVRATLPINSRIFNVSEISIEVVFNPNFEPNDGIDRNFFDNSGRTLLRKNNDDTLELFFGATTKVADVALATFQPLWRVGQRNVLTAYGKASGENVVMLNGTEISDTATTWTPQEFSTLYLMSNNTGNLQFDGTILSLKVWHAERTLQEHIDAYRQTTYNYMKDVICHLPMDAKRYDPTGSKTLDVSGNFNDGILEATVAKLPTRGFKLPGVSSNINLAGMTTQDGNHSICALLRSTNTTDAYKYILAASTGENLYAFRQQGLNEISIYNVTWKSYGVAPKDDNEIHSLIYSQDADRGVSELFIDGVLSGSVAYSSVAIAGNVRVFSYHNGTSSILSGDLFELRVIPRPLTPTQAADLHARLMEGVQNV